jgi:ribosomal protein S18 acetylase RimI-like enzyme
MTAPVQVLALLPSQTGPAARLLARAFEQDPFFTFMLPQVDRRRRSLPWLFERTVRYCRLYGRADTTPGLEGLALWLGPRRPSLAGWGILRTGLFLLPLRLSVPEFSRSVGLANAAGRLHKDSLGGPHWYLYSLGVEPARQGRGLGQALLQPVLAEADRARLPCYLDTNNERNLAFYESCGFRVVGQARAFPSGPPTWGMCRLPPGD